MLRALLACLLLSACASPLPEADPAMAWVELRGQVSDIFMADRLDGVRTADGRYFQVTPDAHRLEARYDFEISGGGTGLFGDSQHLRCTLLVRYDAFQAGQRYVFEARSLGFQPQGWLRDEQGKTLARAEATRCI